MARRISLHEARSKHGWQITNGGSKAQLGLWRIYMDDSTTVCTGRDYILSFAGEVHGRFSSLEAAITEAMDPHAFRVNPI